MKNNICANQLCNANLIRIAFIQVFAKPVIDAKIIMTAMICFNAGKTGVVDLFFAFYMIMI
jgi:hypothetical protein